MKRFLFCGFWAPGILFLWPWIGSAAGYAIGSPLLLPLLDVLPAYAVMLVLLYHGRRGRAVGVMLMWALGMLLAGTTLVTLFPERSATLILNGVEYRLQMFEWIRTGIGAESDPRQFIPQHLGHIVVFLVLSLGTVSLLSMIFGSILMNYMSFYVGSLILEADIPLRVIGLGWPPWSLFRVASFVTLGVILAEPLLFRLWKKPFRFGEITPFLIAAAIGLGLDLILKSILAPWWRVWLLAAAGPAIGSR